MKNSVRKVGLLLERLVSIQIVLYAVAASSLGFRDTNTSSCPETCYCDKDQHVVDCGYRSLVGSPRHVPATTRHYSVAGNRIYRMSADSLVGLEELVSLDLSDNFIAELPNDLFRSTPKLSILRLNGNRFASIPAASLLELDNLQQLYLTRNRIVSLSVEADLISPNLLTLDLSGNKIVEVPDLFLDRFPDLHDLRLSKNHLTSLQTDKWTDQEHGLKMLDISSNSIELITWNEVVFHKLMILNASNNLLRVIDASWFTAMPNLNVLKLCANQIGSIADNTFIRASSMKQLFLCELPNIHYIDVNSFAGLPLLEELDLSSSYNLLSIHPDAFSSLHRLRYLNIRNNRLKSLQMFVVADGSNPNAVNVYLAGTHWLCDCRLKWMYDAHMALGSQVGHDIVCSSPSELRDVPLFEVKEYEFSCESSEHHHVDDVVSAHISTTVILHCSVEVLADSEVVWTTSRGTVIRSVMSTSNSEHSSFLEPFSYSVVNRGANISEKFTNTGGHFSLLTNGSLLIKDVTGGDTGGYICSVVNSHGNLTVITELRLDYSCVSRVMWISVVVGGSTAFGLLLIALIIGMVRHFASYCSDNKRKKRRGLRELLSQMRNSSHFDRLSAYRAAKMDKLSAFKSATMDHLSSFTNKRVGRLRKYKQATVSSVLHHLERMREYYSEQMDHIKESYNMNRSRLRRSYMARFRDNRSTSVRQQYRASVARAREYTNGQVARLREQYKQQQQHLLKLLQLIDVGSCVSSSVEEECMRAESAIFDSTAELDDEARPSYASRPDDGGMCVSSSSLPDDYRHFTLPGGSDDFCDVHDYCGDDVTLATRATSVPNMEAYRLDTTHRAEPLLRVRSNSATRCCQKAMSSHAVVSADIHATAGGKLSHATEHHDHDM